MGMFCEAIFRKYYVKSVGWDWRVIEAIADNWSSTKNGKERKISKTKISAEEEGLNQYVSYTVCVWIW